MDLTVKNSRSLKRKNDSECKDLGNGSSRPKSARLQTLSNKPQNVNECNNYDTPIDLSVSSQKNSEHGKGNVTSDLRTDDNIICDTAVDLSCSSSNKDIHSEDKAVDLTLSSPAISVRNAKETIIDLSCISHQKVSREASTSQVNLDSSESNVQNETSKSETSGEISGVRSTSCSDTSEFEQSNISESVPCDSSQIEDSSGFEPLQTDSDKVQSEISQSNKDTAKIKLQENKQMKDIACSKSKIEHDSNVPDEEKSENVPHIPDFQDVSDVEVEPSATESPNDLQPVAEPIASETESALPNDSSANIGIKMAVIHTDKNACDSAETVSKWYAEPVEIVSTDLGESVTGTALLETPITQEEQDRFEFISQQLNILNTDDQSKSSIKSTKNKPTERNLRNKRRLAAVKKALKSPRKAASRKSPTSAAASKGSKKKKSEGETTVNKSSTSRGITDSGESDSSMLEIDDAEDEINSDLDEKLEENAIKNNLTAINVKNILHQVVTNEHVLEMVKNSLTTETKELRPAAYVPKMTRSKAKLWQAPEIFPWLASPSKNASARPTILDLTFSEEEDDDDLYEPEKDPLLFQTMDSDADSIISSWMSDFGSPCPTTPTTPCATSTVGRSDCSQSQIERKDSGSDSELFQSPMNPPLVTRQQSNARHLGKKYQEALLTVDDEDDPENVATRTRSKVALNDTSILELEASFIAPDITADMYDLDSDDPDYSSFLTGLVDFPACTELNEHKDQVDDEVNDPEYNYLAEYEEPDAEDLRYDRGTRIPKKELNMLFEELLQAFEDSDEEDTDTKMKKVPNADFVKFKPKIPAPIIVVNQIKITAVELAQIKDQMKKHVQLMTQVFVLSAEHYRGQMRKMLNELHGFGSILPCGGESSFRPSNLIPAITLIEQPLSPTLFLQETKTTDNSGSCEKSIEQSPKKSTKQSAKKLKKQSPKESKKQSPSLESKDTIGTTSKYIPRFQKRILPELTNELKELFCCKETFCFPQLLPCCLFTPLTVSSKTKLTFTEAEDNLIALGLEQFDLGLYKLAMIYELISEHMLPIKTYKQIRFRVKNQMAKKTSVFVKEGKLPVPHTTDLNGIVSSYPDWYQETTKKLNRECIERLHRPRSHSVGSIENVSKEMQAFLSSIKKDKTKRSAPVTPIKGPPMTPIDFVKVMPLSGAIKKILDCQQRGEGSAKEKVAAILKIPAAAVKESDSKTFISPAKFSDHLQGAALFQSSLPVCLAVMPVASASVGNITSTSEKINLLLTPVKATSPVVIRSLPLSTACVISNPTMPVTEDCCALKASTVTCVASTILIYSTVEAVSNSLTKTTTTMSQGLISCPEITNMTPKSQVATPKSQVASQSLTNMTPKPQVAPQSLTNMNPKSQVAPQSHHSANLTAEAASSSLQQSQSALNISSTSKTAEDILSAFGPFSAVTKAGKLSGLFGQMTPTKKGRPPRQKFLEKTPTKCIVPSPHTSPTKRIVLPFIAKKLRKNSPRRKRLNQHAKAILPKGFIVRPDVKSPVKKAADKAKTRACKVRKPMCQPMCQALCQPRCLLPKLEDVSTTEPEAANQEAMEADVGQSDAGSECESLDSEPETIDDTAKAAKFVQANEKDSATKIKPTRKRHVTPPPESADSQTEEEDGETTHLQELMEASSTIRHQVGSKKKLVLKDRRTKAQKHKDSTLALLDPDLILTDPIRDDRDIAFAQAYLQSVQVALKDNPNQYQKFLKLLHDFGKSSRSPCDLYEEMKTVLEDHPDLVEDFSGFLLPQQAVECGCYMANRQYHKVRSFLRKLEIHFEKHPSHFQKITRTFCQSWRSSPHELKSMLQPLLKGQHHLLSEFSQFFDDERPPESNSGDFEEIDLCDSDGEENRYLDGFEEVSLEDYVDHHGTNLCPCHCHDSKTDVSYFKRRKHCRSCGIKIVGGKIYFRSTGNNLIPAKVVYHESFYMDESRRTPEKEKQFLQEQIQTALTKVENTKCKSQPEKSDKGLVCLVRKRIKPITLVRSDQPGGRFIALDEFDETQSIGPWVRKNTESIKQSTDRQLPRLQHVKSNNGGVANSNSEFTPSAMQVSSNSAAPNKIVLYTGDRITSPEDKVTPKKQDTTTKRSVFSIQPPSPGTSAMGVYDSPPDTSVFPTSWPSFLSPSKDSNCSVSQDILAKAMKSAMMSNSDCELSIDFSSCGKFSVPNPGTSQQGDITTASSSNQGQITPETTFQKNDQQAAGSTISWSREDDQLILDTIKAQGLSDAVFHILANQMPGKTAPQIRDRIVELLTMLQPQQGNNVGSSS